MIVDRPEAFDRGNLGDFNQIVLPFGLSIVLEEPERPGIFQRKGQIGRRLNQRFHFGDGIFLFAFVFVFVFARRRVVGRRLRTGRRGERLFGNG